LGETWLQRFRGDPLAWPYREVLARIEGDAPDVAALARALDTIAGVRFERSQPPPRRRRRGSKPPRDVTAYDRSIVEQRVVPTREHNDHDLANALVWARFPASKAALHARQLLAVREARASVESKAGAGPGAPWTRTAEGDALAMLDEGGIAFVVREARASELADELLRGDDPAVATRAAAGDALGIVFGHGLLEHQGRPRAADWRPMAGLAVILPFLGDPREVPLVEVDRALAARIDDPTSFRARDGHGIGSATPSVLGTGK
jgi:hypothetical protein